MSTEALENEGEMEAAKMLADRCYHIRGIASCEVCDPFPILQIKILR
jgi:hypothetical protein